MSDMKQEKKPSTMAFMLLPQFGQSFRAFSFIVPVFIRTLALMFSQAGLIAESHPALNYGVQGVERIGFSRLMGEAWVGLRTLRRTTPYQWCVFFSVLLMVSLVFAAIIMWVFTIGFGIGKVAQAQLFTLNSGPTDMSTVPAGGAGYAFDKTIPGSGGHADYGIMLLDKVFRQGMMNSGGRLQNAVGSLLDVYNTGVLVIAGVMLFWAVVSVVVDTAKTGQIGGGRHNMVWAPIRIIFALGLLIPLGGVGFSSGQFMVLKLAEWGSNLASNGWQSYVDAVVNGGMGDRLVLNQKTANVTELVNDYQKMWLCRVAYNAASIQSSGPFPGGSPHRVTQINLNSSGLGEGAYAFTNARAANLCGTLTYQNTSTAATTIVGGLAAVFSGPILGPLIAAQAVAYQQMTDASRRYFDPTYGSYDPTVADNAAAFACEFVSRHVYGGPYGDPVLATGDCPGGFAYGFCGANPTTPGPEGWPPTNSPCFINSVFAVGSAYQQEMNNLVGVMNTSLHTQLIQEANLRGWPAMGGWFLRIAQVNSGAESLTKPAVSIKPGDLWKAASGTSSVVGKVGEVMSKYHDWWKKITVTGSIASTQPALPGSTVPTQSNTTVEKQPDSSDLTSLSKDSIWSFFLGGSNADPVFYTIVDPANQDSYPLAELISVGNTIFTWGLRITAVTTLAPILVIAGSIAADFFVKIGTLGLADLASTITGIVGIAETAMSGPVGHLLITLGTTLMLAGGILKFWVPLVPFIRVAFSVLTWIISVFEAVAMVPIAALSHLHTEGDGLAGGAKTAWILWLNVLLRPIVTVVAFVGVMLVFNGFVLYFHQGFMSAAALNTNTSFSIQGFMTEVANTVIYTGMIYTVSNTVFKMLEIVPNGIMRWMGGSPDHSLDSHGDVQGLISAAGQQVSMASNKMMMSRDDKAGLLKAGRSMNTTLTRGLRGGGGSGGP